MIPALKSEVHPCLARKRRRIATGTCDPLRAKKGLGIQGDGLLGVFTTAIRVGRAGQQRSELPRLARFAASLYGPAQKPQAVGHCEAPTDERVQHSGERQLQKRVRSFVRHVNAEFDRLNWPTLII